MGGPVESELLRALGAEGLDLEALGLAWVRVIPIVAIVPAFGLRALPAAARGVFAIALAALLAPSVALTQPIHLDLLAEATHGLSIAIAAAVPLWAATMAGGVIDSLRASSDQINAPTVEGRATPLGVPLSMLASAIFLASGGASRAIALALRPAAAADPVLLASRDLVAGVALAVSIGAPVLVASVVVEIGAALVARASSPAQVHLLLAPLRALAVLAVLAIGIERIAGALAVAAR